MSLILILAMCLSLGVPALANNEIETNETPSFQVIDSLTNELGAVIYEISECAGVYYLFEMNDKYTAAFTLTPDMRCSYCVQFNDSSQIICGEIGYTNYSIQDYSTIFEIVQEELGNENVPESLTGVTEILSVSNFSEEIMPLQNDIDASDQAAIDAVLRADGYPDPYELKFLAAGGNALHRCELYETLLYLYTDNSKNIFVEAYTVVSVIAVVLGMPESYIAAILTLAFNAAGQAVAARDSRVNKYDVTALFSKYAYVDGDIAHAAARQINWYAWVGECGATYSLKNENISGYYNLSNQQFIMRVLEDYGN